MGERRPNKAGDERSVNDEGNKRRMKRGGVRIELKATGKSKRREKEMQKSEIKVLKSSNVRDA